MTTNLKQFKFLFVFILILGSFLSVRSASAADYYISNTGLDTNNGTSESTPWQTIAKVNSSTFLPGDNILFKMGDVWRESLIVPSSGSVGNHITFGAYGSGEKPTIYGSEIASNFSDHWSLDESLSRPTSTGDLPNNWMFRTILPASIFTVNGETITIGLSSASNASSTVSSVYIGEKNDVGDEYDMKSGTIEQILFSGNVGTIIPSNTTITSDVLTFNYDKTKTYIISIGVSAGGIRYGGKVGTSYSYYFSGQCLNAGMSDVSSGSSEQSAWYGLNTVSITNNSEGSKVNTWAAPFDVEPFELFMDTNRGKKVNSLELVDSYFDYYWAAGKIYIYSEADPIINYSTIDAGKRSIAIDDNSNDYIIFDNLRVEKSNNQGFYIRGDNNIVKNSFIRYIGNGDVGGLYGHGILIYGNFNSIINNEVAYIKGAGVAVVANHILIELNDIHNNWNLIAYPLGGNGTGITFSAGASNGIARKNNVHDNYLGISDDNSSDIEIYNNLVTNNMLNSIDHWNGTSGHPVKIYNNTVIHNPAYTSGHGISLQAGGDFAHIKNNIIYMSYTGLNFNVNGLVFQFSNYTDIDVNNNLIYNIVGGTGDSYVMASGKYNTLSSWQTALANTSYLGKDANSINADPLFTSLSDFHLQTGSSPAINAGVNVGVTTDFEGNLRTGNPDIGAYEYQPAVTTYTLTYTASSNGTIVGTTPQTINQGSNGTAVTATPSTGYHFTSWSDNSTTNPRTDTNITGNISVSASFAINTYNITSSTGLNGTISPLGATTKDYNTSQIYTITPSTGYHVSDVLIDGASQGAITTYTFSNITTTHTISVTFALDATPTYTLTITSSGTGTGTTTGANTYDKDTIVNATATPSSGSTFTNWSGDCNSNGQVTMTANKTCIATFTLTPTTPPSSGGGSHSSGGGSYIKQPTLNTTSTTPTPTPAPLIITRTLKLKDIGDDVMTLQTYLKKEGYIINSIDGIFGNETKQAVISFQKANILTYDGIVGPKTREVITKISNNNIPVSSTVPVTNTNDTSFIFSKSLKLGSDHNDITEVNQLQKYLNTHGYIIKYSGFNSPGNETYYYGVSVKTALIKFQKANSLTPDGIFGSKTREVMNRGR